MLTMELGEVLPVMEILSVVMQTACRGKLMIAKLLSREVVRVTDMMRGEVSAEISGSASLQNGAS